MLVANYRAVPVRPGLDGQAGARAGTSTSSTTTAPAPTTRGRQHRGPRSTEQRPVGLFDGYTATTRPTPASFRGGCYYTGDKAWRDGTATSGSRAATTTSSPPRPTGSARSRSRRRWSSTPPSWRPRWSASDDPERTQIVIRLLVLAPGYDAERRARPRSCRTTQAALTAPYKYPREIHFVAELPKTVSGKIRRSATPRPAASRRDRLSARRGPTPVSLPAWDRCRG